jgi:polyphosphate kinase
MHLLSRLHYGDKDEAELLVDPDIIFEYQDTYIKKGLIAPWSADIFRTRRMT